jgi:hypothetical protein
MACERYREALTDLAAGCPAEPELTAHLEACAACREEIALARRALEAVDADLRQLAACEPSRELAARIRMAAAEDAGGPIRRSAWLWPALAAAGMLAVAVVTAKLREPGEQRVTTAEDRRPHTASTPTSEPRPAHAIPSPLPAVPAARAPAATTEPHARAAGLNHAAVPSEPEVLVPSGEAEALLRFARGAARRTLTAQSLVVADLSAPLPEPERVEIRPLEIVPLDPEEDSGAE